MLIKKTKMVSASPGENDSYQNLPELTKDVYNSQLVMATYYDRMNITLSESEIEVPHQLMYMDFCSMLGRFALAVYLDPGIFQLCDPYSL